MHRDSTDQFKELNVLESGEVFSVSLFVWNSNFRASVDDAGLINIDVKETLHDVVGGYLEGHGSGFTIMEVLVHSPQCFSIGFD